jgi:hypothetical protein
LWDGRQAVLYAHKQTESALHVCEAAGYRRDGTVRETHFRGVRLREPSLIKQL